MDKNEKYFNDKNERYFNLENTLSEENKQIIKDYWEDHVENAAFRAYEDGYESGVHKTKDAIINQLSEHFADEDGIAYNEYWDHNEVINIINGYWEDWV